MRNLSDPSDMKAFCREAADAILAQRGSSPVNGSAQRQAVSSSANKGELGEFWDVVEKMSDASSDEKGGSNGCH